MSRHDTNHPSQHLSLPTLSFAQAAALPSRTTNTSRTSKPPLRYVVNFKGNPPPHAERIPSERATRKINERLRSMTPVPNLLVLGVSCKPNGNYIISYSNSSSETDAEKLKHILSETLAPNNPNASVNRDIPWTRILVHNIARKDDNDIDRSEEDIDAAIRLNPILHGTRITQTARWILPPDHLQDKHASSISFTFIDNPVSIVDSLLTKPFHMFGCQVRVELWQNLPKPAQCKCCWKVTHNTQNCNAVNHRYWKCGKIGTEETHNNHCAECKRLPSTHSDDVRCSLILSAAIKGRSRSRLMLRFRRGITGRRVQRHSMITDSNP